jgi:hypothetical protein
VTGKRLARRIGITLALTAGLCIFLSAIDAQATPIRPDIKKLVAQPQQDSAAQFMPARAGWEGPEMARNGRLDNPALEDSAAATRAWRAALMAAATPDPGAILGILALIFLLRVLRGREQERHGAGRAVAQMENKPERLAA